MITVSFDEFVEQGCSTEAVWNTEGAKVLSIQDIGDWSAIFEVTPREPASLVVSNSPSCLGLINCLSYIEPVQAGLMARSHRLVDRWLRDGEDFHA